MHSYSGSVEILNALNKLYPNFYFSFSMNSVNNLNAVIPNIKS